MSNLIPELTFKDKLSRAFLSLKDLVTFFNLIIEANKNKNNTKRNWFALNI